MGIMMLRTILIGAFGVLSGISLISDRFNLKKTGFAVKPLIIPLLALFYYFAAQKPDLIVMISFCLVYISDLLFLNSEKKKFILPGIICMSLFYAVFSIFILRNNYFQQYIPLWFYVFIVPLVISAYIIFNKIKDKLLNHKIPVIIYTVFLIIFIFLILCRAWRYRDLSLYLPVTGSALLLIASVIYALHKYNHEIKYGMVYYNFCFLYGLMFLIMGIMPDW